MVAIMEKSRSTSPDLIRGSLLKNIILFALPLMVMNLLQMMFNAADSIIVGKFAGENYLAAVGVTASLIFLFVSLFQGLATGTNVVVAREIGAGNDEAITRACRTSFVIGLWGGLFLTVAVYLLAPVLLALMDTPTEIIDYSVAYLRIYFMGAVFVLNYNFGSAILRAKGDTRRPLYFLAISGVTNVLLNYVFVVFFSLNVYGVALATVISQALSCVLVLLSLSKEADSTRFAISELSFDGAMALQLVRIGIPAGIQGVAFSFTNVVIQSSLNSFDSANIIAGNTAANNMENFIYIGMMAFNNATITFTSQFMGAKRYERLLPVLFITLFLNMLSSIVVSGIVYYHGSFFLAFFTDSPEVIAYGMVRLFYVGLFLFLNGALDVLSSAMRGMGYSFTPTAIMMAGIIGIRLFWLWTYFPSHPYLEVVYQCFPISWLFTVFIDILVYIYIYRKAVKGHE